MTTAIVGTRDTSRYPEFAGSTWVRLQYMIGLERLGLRPFWVDRLTEVDPTKDPHSAEYLARRFEEIAGDFGFADRYCLIYGSGKRHFGLSEQELLDLVDQADLLINISGALDASSPLMRVPRRAYIDVDPGFTQVWATEHDMALEHHTHFFTIGQNVGEDDFRAPTLGLDWHRILPPVVLDQWPANIDERCRRFSTVADWRSSQTAVYNGDYLGPKREEFLRLLDLPERTGARIEPALCIGQGDHQDLGALHSHGWRIADPAWCTGDPHSYREFIRYSRAELSVAKSGYIKTRSGWISDRTACYLASGKPAVVQSTGFERRLSAGEGLIAFRTPDEAVAAIEAVNDDYPAHCRAARELAETRFDSKRVLTELLERVDL